MAAAEQKAAETLPRQFGKYTLLRRLASGGMAELYLALLRSVAGFEKLLVIKRILPSMNADRGFIDMLLHEARIAASLSHPNVVQIFDVGQHEGTYYIAMEHIHGEDIQAIIQAMMAKGLTEFPLEHALTIVMGAAAGLAYAHEKRDRNGRPLGIVHRDVSPRNIVISFTGDVKVVDFGIARSTYQPGEDVAGLIKGKAPYMSPEQASGQTVDHRSDIFSTGIILFELTTGRRLFKGASEYETLKLIVDKEYPRPSEIRPDYPPELERIVMRALEKDREARYQSARELQADLEAFVRQERVAVSPLRLIDWMGGLFERDLRQQNEALSDVMHLADVIAGQREEGEDGAWPRPRVRPEPAPREGGGPNTDAARAATLSTVPPGAPRPFPWLGVGLAVALGAAGFAWVQRARPAAPIASGAANVAEGEASVRVISAGAACAVEVNGVIRGSTPVEVKVRAGAVEVSCQPERGSLQRRVVQAAPGEVTTVSFDPAP